MISPPKLENNDRFEQYSEIFLEHQISVPKIISSDKEKGWYLITDLGSKHLDNVYGTPAQGLGLKMAIETLIKIQQVNNSKIQPYSTERFKDELVIFKQWFVEKWLGGVFPQRVFTEPFNTLIENGTSQQQCCVHRDYHCRNILFSEQSIGIVDFQDAVIGPVTYDLASLLRDCYHRFSDAEIDEGIALYKKASVFTFEEKKFKTQFDLTAIQRQLKAIGIFARLYLRDGKSSHMKYIDGVIEHTLDVCKKHPAMYPMVDSLKDWKIASTEKLGRIR